VCPIVTRNPDGSYPLLGGGVTDRIAEFHNALDVYAGQNSGSGTTNSLGYYQTGNITMVEGGLRDDGRYDNKDASLAWIKWGNSVGNSDGIADGRYAAAYTVARAIRRFRPEVVMTAHDFEGDYGHAAHTASAIATTEGYELVADANVDIDGLPAWLAKKLYIRGDDTDNTLTRTYKLVHSTDLQNWSNVVMQGVATRQPITYNSVPQDGGNHFYRLILSVK